MSQPVNHFRIKRQAHHLSRQNTNASFNPFAHISWGRNRRGTFPQGRDLEAGDNVNTDDEDQPGSPMTQTQTAPGHLQSSGALHNNPKDEDLNSAEKKSTEQDSGETCVGSQAEPGDASSNLKNRGAGATGRKTTDAAAPDQDRASQHERDDSDKDDKNKPKKSGMFKHIEPKEPFTVANQLQRTFLNSWINVLLIAAPIGIALHFTKVTPIVIFVVNFIAIIPLAAMLSFATEEIALRTGETLGGLLNATFGNAVELIVAIVALLQQQVTIVQTSLIGSILSNLLLVMGMCFFFGGLRRQEQFFNTTVAQTAASLLALAVAGVIVPTVFDAASITLQSDVAELSRGTSLILLVVYAAYLFFQLKTHQAVFSEESKKVPAKPFKHHRHKHHLQKGAVKKGLVNPAGLIAHGVSDHDQNERFSRLMQHKEEDEDAGEEPQLHFFVALGLLAGSTVVIAFCAEFLVDSIDYVTQQGHISKEFLGLILLPIVGNAAEHATAVTVAMKDKMDLAIGVAVGSSMQVALFLIPLLVVIGWGMHVDKMSLSFDIFQVAVLFVAVLLVNYLIADGKSHWLEGMLLMCLYCIIAVCSWWYPVPEGQEVS